VFPFFGLFVLFFDSTFGARWLRRALRRVARALSERHRRAVAYRDLGSLDEYMLRDIGLSHRAASEWQSQRHDRP
jgi:hypothetical protein